MTETQKQIRTRGEESRSWISILEISALLATSAGAILTAVFIGVTARHISLQTDQQEIENAFLIRDKLTPHLELVGSDEPFQPDSDSLDILGVRQEYRNATSGFVIGEMTGAQIFDCTGEPANISVVRNRGTSSEAVVTPAAKDLNQSMSRMTQLAPYTTDTITITVWSLSNYTRKQLALIEEEQLIIVMTYMKFWVDGVESFTGFIRNHSEYFGVEGGQFSDTSETHFGLTTSVPVVVRLGDGTPQVVDTRLCRTGIDKIRHEEN